MHQCKDWLCKSEPDCWRCKWMVCIWARNELFVLRLVCSNFLPLQNVTNITKIYVWINSQSLEDAKAGYASQKNIWGKYNWEIEVWKLLVKAYGKNHVPWSSKKLAGLGKKFGRTRNFGQIKPTLGRFALRTRQHTGCFCNWYPP